MMRSVILVMALALAATGAVAAEEPDDVLVQTVDGLRFMVPEDWPMKRHGGAVGPIPIEEYIAMKFKALEARLQAMEQQVNQLTLRLRVMESVPRAPELRSGEAAPEESPAP